MKRKKIVKGMRTKLKIYKMLRDKMVKQKGTIKMI
jgi:hypothetical protein